MTVQDIDVDHNIWGNSVPYLKVRTNSKKHISLAGDLVQVTEELVNLHKYIYLTEYLLFVNSIPLFITLSRKIFFVYVNHLSFRKVDTIFKAFKKM